MSASMPAARFSRVWRASSSSPWRMSSMTLAQIAEKPITVATEEAISNFVDSRQGHLALLLRRPKGICSLPNRPNAPSVVAARLSGYNDELVGYRMVAGMREWRADAVAVPAEAI